jgi:vanillate monooxygenase
LFPKNAWYAACTETELGSGPLGRRVCGEALVFFRGSDGQAVGLEDLCPHRGAPLSLGSVCEGRLVCGYHGLEVGCDGKPMAMPQQRVRGFPAVRRFPTLQRYGFIWVWPGRPDQADASRLPNLAWAEDSEWTYGGGVYRVGCDYRLMIDNLMDLTHEKYVHASSVGQKELDDAPPTTSLDGDVVVTGRDMVGVKAPPFWANAMRGNGLDTEALVDRWQRCRFIPPSSVLIDVGVALAGNGGIDAPAPVKTSGIVVDLITPETETSHWYFWGLARNFKVHDLALTESIRDAQGKVFLEDVAMLEAQQRNLSARPQFRLLSLNTDAGGVMARSIIDRLLAEEATAA